MTRRHVLLLLPVLLLLVLPSVHALDFNYWIEPDANGNPVNVWVKVPSISAGGSVTIYAWVESGFQPNGDEVFEFFDDFDGTTLDTNKWTIVVNNGGAEVNNGILTVWGQASNVTKISADYNFALPYVVMTLTKWDKLGAGVSGHLARPVAIYNSDDTQFANFGWYSYGAKDVVETVGTDIAFQDQEIPLLWHEYDFYVTESNAWVIRDHTRYEANVSPNVSATPANTLSIVASDSNVYMDWIAVRKYAPQSPTVSVTALGGYYKIVITNPNSIDLNDFQVAIPATDLSITSTTESIRFSDQPPIAVAITHSPTAQSDLALDPEANITSVVVDYNAVFNKNNVVVTYYRAYDGDSNATILEGNDDVNYITFSREFNAVGDYNTCVYVEGVDDLNAEYNAVSCDVVHIDEYPQGLSISWDMNGLKIPFPDENITFGGSATDNGTLTYSWDLGDGNTASGQTVSHAYGSAGAYTVTLTVTDDVGLSKSVSVSVPVYSVPRIEGNTSVLEHHYSTYTFSSDPRLEANVSIDWGDGTASNTVENGGLKHSWAPGTYTIKAQYMLSDGYNTREYNTAMDVNVSDITYSFGTSCANATLLTITSKDEINGTTLSPTYTLYMTAKYPDGYSEEYSAQAGGSTVYLCASTQSSKISIDGQISASLDSYTTRQYFFDLNAGATESLTTYLAPIGKASPITVTVLSPTGTPVSAGYKVIATRYYPNVSGYVAIAGGITDVQGKTAMYLIPYEVYYRFRVIEPNGQITEYPPQLITSPNVSLQISGTTTTTDYSVLHSTVAKCWYDPDTNMVKCTWTNKTGTDVHVRMDVKRRTVGASYQTIWSQDVTTSSGLLAYDVNDDGDYVVELLMLQNGTVVGTLASATFAKGNILNKDALLGSALTATAAGFAGVTVAGGLIGVLFALMTADVFGVPVPIALIALVVIVIIANRRAVQ